ncbi:TetR/AcrR family transcriptional regulator [Aneurinibacillus terranovensis]|uniref:TetR/AcrR family transcriptional regulator n=1 Tax=Aneurinibacillus terranovensis TaxID=278991 RepID=UPI0004079349|nr:TetR/AcrR family transcriptional regulator [Aneurinibacillus terranovensis]
MINSFQKRILAAANKIFIDKGYQNADMRSIAKEAGIAVGTIYNYYPNKAVLYQDILNEKWQDLSSSIIAITEEPIEPIEKLSTITGLLFQFIGQQLSIWNEIVEDPNRSEMCKDEGRRASELAHQQLNTYMCKVFTELGLTGDLMERHILMYEAAVTYLGKYFSHEMEKNRQYIMLLMEKMMQTS